ncbi:MAG: hypothetical protein BMS9Abin20_1519 [Acidimicrobiia bacterium]|nr:MAG: hypothetical protein BMS9Abin20_1519 [Acidimicrobiia bacterium]
MPRIFAPRSVVASLVIVVALVATACTNAGDGTSSSSPSGTTQTTITDQTTTVAPLTSLPLTAIPGSNSPSIPDDVAASMREEIGVLILDTEESRGLPFLAVPTVTILDKDEFTARLNANLEENLDAEGLVADEAMLKLLGMLDADVDLRPLLVDLYTEQVFGFYDPKAKELVVQVSVDGITPLQEIAIVHELVHALTNQHFDYFDEYKRRIDEGTGDDASGLLALFEGDATYQQFLFLQSLGPAEAAQAAIEISAIDTSILDLAPEWMRRDLAFPYEQGFTFLGQIVTVGGLKGVDEAYQDPPISSEQILDPNKYFRKEQPGDLEPLTVTLDGWDLVDEATFGEWGIRLLLTDTLLPGELTQAAAGWGNDTYSLFTRGDDTSIAWEYLGESEQDAEDLANGLIAHARGAMEAGDPQESGGGLLFDGSDPYVFIDRVDKRIFFVASTDPAAGASLRDQLGL